MRVMISCSRDHTGSTRDREAHLIFIPAMLIWELVQGDSSVSTRTFEKPLHTIMPVEVMLFADAGLQRFEVGVGAL